MKIRVPIPQPRHGGFTLVDAVFAMAAAGVMFGAMYAGIAFGFNTIKFARENTRATQILLQRMELIRLYRWDQLSQVNQSKLTEPYSSIGGTNSGLMYTVQVTIASADLPTSYSDDLKTVTVDVTWSTGKTPRKRSMSTLLARNGMQSYVY